MCACVCMCARASECSCAQLFSVKMRCLFQTSPLLLQASACVTLIVFATHAKYLLFPCTFCRQALVPQLLFVSVLETKKQKEVLAICNFCATAPPYLLAEGGGDDDNKTKLANRTANKTENNSRGACLYTEINSREGRRCSELPAFALH